MQQIAYLNGNYVPSQEARLSVTDGGFVQGVTLAEQLAPFEVNLFLSSCISNDC